MAVIENITTPIDSFIVDEEINASGLASVGRATIRELVALVNRIEARSGQSYIRMEMGVPGLEAPSIGIEAEIAALHRGVASKYPMLEGIPPLKKEISRFCSQFLNIKVDSQNCFPTVGSAQGAFATFLVANRTKNGAGTLFIDPGFPNQKRQLEVIGQHWGSFDVYTHRGEKLREALEEHLSTGRYATLLYSNPNNPSWICFSEQELAIIAEVADKYGVIVIEDLAYFGMDYREDYSRPGEAPYQPSVAHFTDNYVLLISSSKVFSYAGQRVASLVVSDRLAARDFPALKPVFGQSNYGKALLFGALHSLSSGVTHSAQYGLAALLKSANDGDLPFLNQVRVYEERARKMKQLLLENGFELVYAEDQGRALGDGFYFTFYYPGMESDELVETLLHYGISALSLSGTGSERSEGLRACVSQISDEMFPILEERLKAFHHDASARQVT
ncbi:MAG: pyridoxal phosphate-dependent aminotransferase [Oceanospirillales bacterium]|nr:pyridoxal phosphate-dependent aminotransferase [Oceanospirillales bacterium]